MRTFRIILVIASAQLLFSYTSAQEKKIYGESISKPLHNPEDKVENFYSEFGKAWAKELKKRINEFCNTENIKTMRIQILFFAFNSIDKNQSSKTVLSDKLATRTYREYEKKTDGGVIIIPSDELKEYVQGKEHQGFELTKASNVWPTHYIKCIYSVDNETIEIKPCSLTDAKNSQNELRDFGTYSFKLPNSADVKNLIRADDNTPLN